MRRPVAQPPPTLADLASAGVLSVAVWCSECRTSRRLPLGAMIARAGSSLPFPKASARLRCSACGARPYGAQPIYPGTPEGMVAHA
jgi:hypothetical protein